MGFNSVKKGRREQESLNEVKEDSEGQILHGFVGHAEEARLYSMIHEEMLQVGNPEVEMKLCFGLSKMYGFKDLLAKNRVERENWTLYGGNLANIVVPM